MQILLAEDNHINQKVIVGFCQTKGWNIKVAENGRQAVELLETGNFDIILMDVQMPEMNGVEATQIIRTQSMHSDIPIIAVTAHALEGDEERFIAAGMNRYIKKPIDFDLLESTMLELVGRKRSKNCCLSPLNSFKKLQDIIGMGADFIIDIVGEFNEMYQDDMKFLINSLDNNNAFEVSELAHKLKGAVGNFGARDMEEILYSMELAGKNNDVSGVQNLLPSLKKAYFRFNTEFEEYKNI